MKQESVTALIEGLKEAGVNFVTYLPDSLSGPAFEAIRNEPSFEAVAVSHESIGISACVGAWFGGKVPAAFISTCGLMASALHLTTVCRLWGVPILLVIPYRGDLGDAQPPFWVYSLTLEPVLHDLQVPYKIAGKIDEVLAGLRGLPGEQLDLDAAELGFDRGLGHDASLTGRLDQGFETVTSVIATGFVGSSAPPEAW